MMEEILQELIGHCVELRDKIDGVIAGQKERKNYIKNSSISAVRGNTSASETNVKYDISAEKNDISAVKGEVSAVKNELRREISDFQGRIRNIEAGQAAFEERVTCTVDTQLGDMSSVVEQQTRNLREDLNRDIEATRQDVEATRRDLEALTRHF
jgi:polyhydroxyalkanoate synthesis regulator phasin